MAQPTRPVAGQPDFEQILLEPYTYLMNVPGKNVRGMLIQAFNKWLRIPKDKLALVEEVVNMLHTASLLVDDIEDNSKLRRGVPVAHSIYGVPTTINSANYVYFLAMDRVVQLNNFDALKIFTEDLLELHRGQGKDIYWRDANVCPSEEDYLEMVEQKTGGLFRLAVKLMQLFSDNHSDFAPLLKALGLYFQIRDDYMNLADVKYMKNKSFCEDLSEGKFSFPIIHAITANRSDRQLQNVLKQRTEDVDLKRYCLDYMRRMGSLEYTRARLDSLADEILDAIQRLGGNDDLSRLVKVLRNAHVPPVDPINYGAARFD